MARKGSPRPTRWNAGETVLSQSADTGDGVNRPVVLFRPLGRSSLPPPRTRDVRPVPELSFDVVKGPQAPLSQGRGGGGRV